MKESGDKDNEDPRMEAHGRMGYKAQRCIAAPMGKIRASDLCPMSALALPDPGPFLVRLFAALEADGLPVNDLLLDHLCYRVATAERYDALKKILLERDTLLAETHIGGRPIATFRLHAPIVFRQRRIELLELPAPKAGRPYPEGYEHAEFVVHEDLRAFTEHHPGPAWDLSDLDKPTNADVRLRYNGFSVKFHRQPLDVVIANEQRST